MAAGVVSAEDVDRTLKNGVGFRYPWLGPLETADLGGLDVFHGIAQYLLKELSAMTETPEFFDEIVAGGQPGHQDRAGLLRLQPDTSARRSCASAISTSSGS